MNCNVYRKITFLAISILNIQNAYGQTTEKFSSHNAQLINNSLRKISFRNLKLKFLKSSSMQLCYLRLKQKKVFIFWSTLIVTSFAAMGAYATFKNLNIYQKNKNLEFNIFNSETLHPSNTFLNTNPYIDLKHKIKKKNVELAKEQSDLQEFISETISDEKFKSLRAQATVPNANTSIIPQEYLHQDTLTKNDIEELIYKCAEDAMLSFRSNNHSIIPNFNHGKNILLGRWLFAKSADNAVQHASYAITQFFKKHNLKEDTLIMANVFEKLNEKFKFLNLSKKDLEQKIIDAEETDDFFKIFEVSCYAPDFLGFFQGASSQIVDALILVLQKNPSIKFDKNIYDHFNQVINRDDLENLSQNYDNHYGRGSSPNKEEFDLKKQEFKKFVCSFKECFALIKERSE